MAQTTRREGRSPSSNPPVACREGGRRRYAANMSEFRPPVADLAFALEHVVGYDDIAQLPGFEHADLETVTEILSEVGDFMAEVVAPTNRAGDIEGARLNDDGTVTTPTGFKEAYAAYVEA